jgi:hypothetical protein
MSGGLVPEDPSNESFVPTAGVPARVDATSPQGFTHFETGIPTTYTLPLDLQAAALGPGEAVGSWLGPVDAGGIHVSRQGMTHEVDKDAINTLLFTCSQVIGIMLGPDDYQYLRGTGPLRTMANEVVRDRRSTGRRVTFGGGIGGPSVEDAVQKGVQFASLNRSHWEDMVDALSGQLEVALGNHLNFGLPYDRIKSVEMKASFINPGVIFHLTNDSKLHYLTLVKRNRLTEIATYLGQFVRVQ